jgi:hypothetical protein
MDVTTPIIASSDTTGSSRNPEGVTVVDPVDAKAADLSLVPTDADWDDDSPLPPRRPKLFGKATWTLAGILVAAGCFTLGARIGYDSTPAAAATATGRGAATGARATGSGFARGAAGTGAGATGGGGTFGQVQLVDGNNIYIQDSQGNIIKITPAPTATITVNKPGTPADFKPGDSVVVQGTADSNGNIAAATSIAGVTTGGFGRGGAASSTTPAPGG